MDGRDGMGWLSPVMPMLRAPTVLTSQACEFGEESRGAASYFEAGLVCTMGGWEATIKWPPGHRPASDVVCQAAKVRPKHKSANLVGEEIATDSMFDIL